MKTEEYRDAAAFAPETNTNERRTEEGDGASAGNQDGVLSASFLVKTLNTHLAAAGGGSVELKRCNRETGEILEDENEAEMLSQADFQMRAGQLARMLQVLSADEKLEWAVARKEEGNKHFAAMETDRAIQRYLDATVGLDFGNTPEQAGRARELVQLPVLTNLAACYWRKEEWNKVVCFCDQALQVDADYAKALVRRGWAHVELGNLRNAKRDLVRANVISPGCAKAALHRLREASAAEAKAREQRRALAERMLRESPRCASSKIEIPTGPHGLALRRDMGFCEIVAAKLRRFLSFRIDPPVKFE
ncbi:Peptidyl-prolyl cis-trans isomerase FKBP5 [Hondaea fermentalgiana]|uniref:Peptidyl-prolyl cis-trans isomerase FKBP5 n=1 Tax=Hondaea fermentalgiana TaxID=2315210 RepID=A0A2R5GTC1_9STRA|nr:Peptidyl-prolyl cis-trans isomerase FKBP5 [Hondaea fermentalgiana]|eukprot:GBG31903.1 Peptidyl-prolyl cis-trans isomerase FKBP5 [Hondaea fermentalgiana]